MVRKKTRKLVHETLSEGVSASSSKTIFEYKLLENLKKKPNHQKLSKNTNPPENFQKKHQTGGCIEISGGK